MMRKTGLLLLFGFTFLLPPLLFSFEWPLGDNTILSTFGGNGEGNFTTSIQLGSGLQKVHPILNGEIIYFNQGRGDRWGIPSGLGNYAAVEHPGGLRSMYSHLEESLKPRGSYKITQGETVGWTGESGFSMMRNISLSIIDIESRQYINPLILLPPFEDLAPPVIQNLYFKEEDHLQVISDTLRISPGDIGLFLKAYDPGEKVKYFNPMNIFEILVFINGVEKTDISFEGIMELEGSLVLVSEGNPGIDDMFAGSFLFDLGSYSMSPGESRVEIIVADFIGNETSKLFRFIVQD